MKADYDCHDMDRCGRSPVGERLETWPKPSFDVAREDCDRADVVVLVFGRHGQAWEELVLTSPPALHAREQGVDLKPEWANGAKVLIPHVGVAEMDHDCHITIAMTWITIAT